MHLSSDTNFNFKTMLKEHFSNFLKNSQGLSHRNVIKNATFHHFFLYIFNSFEESSIFPIMNTIFLMYYSLSYDLRFQNFWRYGWFRLVPYWFSILVCVRTYHTLKGKYFQMALITCWQKLFRKNLLRVRYLLISLSDSQWAGSAIIRAKTSRGFSFAKKV